MPLPGHFSAEIYTLQPIAQVDELQFLTNQLPSRNGISPFCALAGVAPNAANANANIQLRINFPSGGRFARRLPRKSPAGYPFTERLAMIVGHPLNRHR